MNKYILAGIISTVVGASSIIYSSMATATDREDIDEIVDTLTDEQMKEPVKPEHTPVVVTIDKTMVLGVLADVYDIENQNGYTSIARKWKISRGRVRAIKNSVDAEKMDRLPKEVEVIP